VFVTHGEARVGERVAGFQLRAQPEMMGEAPFQSHARRQRADGCRLRKVGARAGTFANEVIDTAAHAAVERERARIACTTEEPAREELKRSAELRAGNGV